MYSNKLPQPKRHFYMVTVGEFGVMIMVHLRRDVRLLKCEVLWSRVVCVHSVSRVRVPVVGAISLPKTVNLEMVGIHAINHVFSCSV